MESSRRDSRKALVSQGVRFTGQDRQGCGDVVDGGFDAGDGAVVGGAEVSGAGVGDAEAAFGPRKSGDTTSGGTHTSLPDPTSDPGIHVERRCRWPVGP